MSVSAKEYLKRFRTRIGVALDEKISRNLSQRIDRIKRIIRSRHLEMFKELATNSSIIESGSAPKSRNITLPQPKWKKLDEDYLKRKLRKLGTLVGGMSFYMFSGELRDDLFYSADPIEYFGTPEITFTQRTPTGFKVVRTNINERTQLNVKYFRDGVKKGDGVFNKRGAVATISINMYPKITSNLTDRMRFDKYLPENILYKLQNYQGKRQRSFMPQYLEWWAKVRIRTALVREL